MGLSQRNCVLLLVFGAAVCVELYQASYVFGRCRCHNFSKIRKINITDFQVIENGIGCNKVELFVSLIKPDNSTENRCIDPQGKLGKDLFNCWERIKKDKSRKMECLGN